MHHLTRLLFSVSGAALITVGLGLTMVKMIHVEFEAQQSAEKLEFILNPVIVDPPNTRRVTELEPLKIIVPPPAPPKIGWNLTKEPFTPEPVTPEDPIKFTIPDPGDRITDTFGADVNAAPILRVGPLMPNDADRSGHCVMQFDVSADGSPFNIQASRCTQSLFRRNSIKATQKFKYRPQRVDGQTVPMRGVTTTIRFKLLDDRGRLIAES